MSIEINAIIAGISEAGQQQISEIENAAEQKAVEILLTAEAKANIQKNRILKDGQARLNRTCALIEQQAIMQALQLHADARQRLIEKVLEKTKEEISTVRNNEKYIKILKMLILNAVDALKPSLLDGQKVILHFDKRDKAIARDLIKEFDDQLTPKYDISCQGGCIAESEDGLVSTLNTFESRFQHSLPLIQQTLSAFFERKISTS
jgi:vacuolar-type H+-ATPase subunit E/Vma4